MVCKMSCPKYYHLPCISASGGFQIFQNHTVFCKEHLGQVPLVCTEDISCRVCSGLGDVSNLMICTMCGDHYHGSCIGVAQMPGVRAGWQCQSCRRCQICRVPDVTEGRTVSCEQCDKIYHAHCLRPIMTSIPKYGWKCRCCRVCSDCGSRTPGAGTSSRWHAHYTVCDSCYQQRNKGFSCPICQRAYRAAAHREMVRCSVCKKFVHNTCDGEADLNLYQARKEAQPDYEYSCTPCKMMQQSGRLAAALRRNSSMDDESMSASQESLYADDSLDSDSLADKSMLSDFGLGKGKPFVAGKVVKKRLGLPIGRPKGSGKNAFQKRQRVAEFGRKRGPKAKMRGLFGEPGLGLQRPTYDTGASCSSSNKNDEEPGIENRLVLCSAKDKFVLTQDICVMCGAIGTDQEGCLISCVQCGQCYHPYCVTVKVTKVILQKGWRCLDCTVCEGCGLKHDEARLILCDDCDISYHIYCMDPPLDVVPHGNWKCKWCAVCQRCGTNSPGSNCEWQNSYTECGPCASQVSCPHCAEGYAEGELIIQCTQCDRWLHGMCDSIRCEEDAEICSEDGYVCMLCRPKDLPPPHLVPKKKLPAVCAPPVKGTPMSPSLKFVGEDSMDFTAFPGPENTHFVDGIFLSDTGMVHIKSLQMELIRKKRKTKLMTVEPPPLLAATVAAPAAGVPVDKDAAILAAIESVVAGSSLDNSLEDIKLEPLDPREEAEMWKDGMVWEKTDATPPEGFTVCQTDTGIWVLRKKRQRNLQKLGIGGFVVRNRGVRKDGGSAKDGDGEETTENSGTLHFTSTSQIDAMDKRRKQTKRKPKPAKLAETYPTYLQEAFFGKGLMDTTKPTKFDSSSSDEDANSTVSDDKTIKLSAEELKMIEAMRAKQQLLDEQQHKKVTTNAPVKVQTIVVPQNAPTVLQHHNAHPHHHQQAQPQLQVQHSHPILLKPNEAQVALQHRQQQQQLQQQQQQQQMQLQQQHHHQQQQLQHSSVVRQPTLQQHILNSALLQGSVDVAADALKDILPVDLLDNDLVNTIINEETSSELNKSTAGIAFREIAVDTELGVVVGADRKDELSHILSPHFNLEFRMDGKDVEEIFKGVLTDESQVSQVIFFFSDILILYVFPTGITRTSE